MDLGRPTADFVDKIHSLNHCMDGGLAEQTLTEDFISFSYGPKLEPLLKVLFGTSISLATAILYFTFHRRFRHIFTLLVAWTWLKITHWRCFTLLMSWEDQLEAAVEELQEIESNVREPEEKEIKMRREERKQRWEKKKVKDEPYLHALLMEKNHGMNENSEKGEKKLEKQERSKQARVTVNNGARHSNSDAGGPTESPDSNGTAVTGATGPDGRPGQDDGPGEGTAESPPAGPGDSSADPRDSTTGMDVASNPRTDSSQPNLSRKARVGSKICGLCNVGGQLVRNPDDEESQRPSSKQPASNSQAERSRQASTEAARRQSDWRTSFEAT